MVAALLLAVHAVLVVAVARTLAQTFDERHYVIAAEVAAEKGFEHPLTQQQGPLFYRACNVFQREESRYLVDISNLDHETLVRARSGTLPFGLLCATLVFLFSRRVFGDAGGLLSLTLYALNPILLGYAGLAVADVHHAAFALLALYLLWRYWSAPSALRVSLMGVAVGLALATKYLSLLVLLPLPLLVAVRAARAGDPGRRAPARALATLAAVAVLAATALLTLYACYGERVPMGTADPALYQSCAMKQLAGTPVLGRLLTLFPAPFLAGVDFQKSVGERTNYIFLDGELSAGHWDYYLWSFLLKTPEPVLAGTAWLLTCWLASVLRRAVPPAARTLALVLLPSMGITFAYMSLCTSLQSGIRYVLMLYPLLFVLLGAAAGARWLRGLAPRGWMLLLGALALFHGLELRASWPGWIGYYNRCAGGQERGYLHFRDSNTDWGQDAVSPEELLRRVPAVQIVGDHSGARFGLLAVVLSHTSQRAGRGRGLARFEWLECREPVDHVGSTWFLYSIEPEQFERDVARDPGLRSDLVVAYLGAGRLADARRHLASLPVDQARRFEKLAGLLERPSREPTWIRATVEAWAGIGRFDQVERLLDGAPDLPGLNESYLRAQALLERGELLEAITVLEQADPDLPLAGMLLLAQLYRAVVRNREAEALIARCIEKRGGAHRTPMLRELQETLQSDWESLGELDQSPRREQQREPCDRSLDSQP